MGKKPQKATTLKWFNALNEIKNELDNNNHVTFQEFISKHNISALWRTFLLSNNILYKENGFYKWNDKIPVSYKLIEKFRNFVHKENYIKYNKETPNLFDMPQTPLPKPPKTRKTRTPKVEVQVKDNTKSDLGVIRKFFKWLW
jgi:hypothetical protein